MSRFYRVITRCGLVCLFFFAIPAHADPIYYVAGSLTVVGNDACGASPCTEWVNFSFDLGWQLNPYASGIYEAYVTNLVASGSGALGSFTVNSPGFQYFRDEIAGVSGPCSYYGDFNYLAFSDPGLDEFDLNLCNNLVPTPEYPWISSAGSLYKCATATCVADFGAYGGIGALRATVEATATRIPEPATITLLALGLLVLALVRAFSLQHESSGNS